MQQNATMGIRSNLRSRLDALADCQPGGDSGLREQLDRIRREAHSHGLIPAAQLAAALGDMLASGTLGRAITSSLDLMRDALDCEDNRPENGAIYMAALTSRFGY